MLQTILNLVRTSECLANNLADRANQRGLLIKNGKVSVTVFTLDPARRVKGGVISKGRSKGDLRLV